MAAEPAPETSARADATDRPAEPQTVPAPVDRRAAARPATGTMPPDAGTEPRPSRHRPRPAVGDRAGGCCSPAARRSSPGSPPPAITGYGVQTALGPPQLDRVQIPLAKLPRAMDGTRLAVVSDIHLGPLTGTDHAGRIVELINSVDADIVCVVGDLVDGTVAELGAVRRAAGATSGPGTARTSSPATTSTTRAIEEWVDEVARLGVRPLRNERLEIGRAGPGRASTISAAAEFGDGPDFGRALGDRDTARPVVLMAHQPVAAPARPRRTGSTCRCPGTRTAARWRRSTCWCKLQQPVVTGSRRGRRRAGLRDQRRRFLGPAGPGRRASAGHRHRVAYPVEVNLGKFG